MVEAVTCGGLFYYQKCHKSGGLQVKPHQVIGVMYSHIVIYRVILSVLDPRKSEYLKDYSLDFEHVYMTTYLAS